MLIPHVMYQGIMHFELNGQLVQTGGGESSNPRGARGTIEMELNEGIALGLKPLRGVIVEKRGGEEFCSHILPIQQKE